ncbi:hypothetical protein CPB86DRAFT_425168 [Serendipita vermifera]|nr:hypothetical protein CPB86DRAFT_425168 [Serendipita vermifera]
MNQANRYSHYSKVEERQHSPPQVNEQAPPPEPVPQRPQEPIRKDTDESNDSALPYLRPEPAAEVPAKPSPNPHPRPSRPPVPRANTNPNDTRARPNPNNVYFDQGSRYPVFRPPPNPHPVYNSPPGPNSMPNLNGPGIDYHSRALSIVGAPPPPQETAPYPVMMRPQYLAQPRASMPVEAVIARYGQSLPQEPIPVVPALPQQETMTQENPRQEHVRFESTPPDDIQPENTRPENRRRESKGHRLTRASNMRRTQSEVPPEAKHALQQSQEDRAHSPQQQPPPTAFNKPMEDKKRPTSLARKLTKQRPVSAPSGVGKVPTDNPVPNRQSTAPVPQMLPEVLFHVRATEDYVMQSYEELSFSKGDIIAVKSAPENGRWIGYVVDSSNKRQEGVFYRTFITLMQRLDSSRTRGEVLFFGKALTSLR